MTRVVQRKKAKSRGNNLPCSLLFHFFLKIPVGRPPTGSTLNSIYHIPDQSLPFCAQQVPITHRHNSTFQGRTQEERWDLLLLLVIGQPIGGPMEQDFFYSKQYNIYCCVIGIRAFAQCLHYLHSNLSLDMTMNRLPVMAQVDL